MPTITPDGGIPAQNVAGCCKRSEPPFAGPRKVGITNPPKT
jgi:hypothetical protein